MTRPRGISSTAVRLCLQVGALSCAIVSLGCRGDPVSGLLNNRPPVATIESPEWTQFVAGDSVVFRGSAVDPEDGVLPDSALRWFIAGPFGTSRIGREMVLPNAALGEHEVLFIARDRQHLADTASVTIRVFSPGTELWSLDLGTGYVGSPALSEDGTVYIPAAERLLAIDSRTGTVRWDLQAPTLLNGVALGEDGNLYLSGIKEFGYPNILSYSPQGELRWTLETPNRLPGIPALGQDGTVFYGVRSIGVWALNPDGGFKWRYDDPYHRGASLAVSGDTVYVGGTAAFYALDRDGLLIWTGNTEGIPGNILGFVALGSDGTAYPSIRGYIAAYAPGGTRLWAYEAGQNGSAAPAVGRDGTLYVGRSDGSLVTLDPGGAVKWTFLPEPPVYPPSDQLPNIGTTPVLTTGGIIYHSAGDYLFAISYQGEEIYRFQTGNSPESFWVPSPVVGPDGTLYVPSTSGMLYAIAGRSRLDTEASWPMIAHDPRHSSRAGGP